eukprot:12885353-Alexandrium_andersonii.AAC.1
MGARGASEVFGHRSCFNRRRVVAKVARLSLMQARSRSRSRSDLRLRAPSLQSSLPRSRRSTPATLAHVELGSA